jgi:DMSO/TMAO reductase YedYZ molybdopterin-dependent catalytic subunit
VTAASGSERGEPAIRRLLQAADDRHKASATRADPGAAAEGILALLERARAHLPEVGDHDRRRDLAATIARRVGDLDRASLEPMLRASADVRRAPTVVEDPRRVPPGQHLTPGFPVLHVGSVAETDPQAWTLTVTGLVGRRTVLGWDQLTSLPTTRVERDFHCVTGWSRLDNVWTGVAVREVLALAGPRPTATHAVVSGRPAYSASLPLEDLLRDDVLFAWAHDDTPLTHVHGGPLRLVVPHRYGWKSVKWAFEVRLFDRDVPGYWEERGYHDVGDPWREQRFRGD